MTTIRSRLAFGTGRDGGCFEIQGRIHHWRREIGQVFAFKLSCQHLVVYRLAAKDLVHFVWIDEVIWSIGRDLDRAAVFGLVDGPKGTFSR